MKKQLLALAVGAAVLPNLAMADGPTLYGKINVSLEQYEDDLTQDDEATEDQWQLDSNSSRIGVKGSFDLDVGDLEAIYKAEFGISVDDGNPGDSPFSQRDIWGGFRGGFGTVIAGNFDTPLKESEGSVDQFNGLNGDIGNLLPGQTRTANMIQYATPELADAITVTLAVRPAEKEFDYDQDGDEENGLADTTYVSVVYQSGGLYGAVAIAQDEYDDGDAELFLDPQSNSPLDITRITVGYEGDGFEVGLIHQTAEEADDYGSDAGEDTSLVVSGAINMDRWTFKAQYGTSEADVDEDVEATLTAVGADYQLAQASKAYFYISELEGDNGTDSLSDDTVGIGFEHKF